jgi:murein DD-endopeptidase MepM/ murein hydrolase activator NlpD
LAHWIPLRLGAALLACHALIALADEVPADEEPFNLRGEWRQGSAIFGHTAPGAKVWFDGRALRVTPQGDFVFGLDRDEKLEAELRVQLGNEASAHSFRYAVARREYDIQNITGLPPAMVNPPAAVLERIRAEQSQVAQARRRDTDRGDFAMPFAWPCTGRISGVFGSQRILNGDAKQPHYGVDVAVPVGTPVHAPASGVVSLAHPDMYYTGGTLMIDHGHGLSSAFLHLSKLLVKVGDEVKQGDVIALSGMTGRATGPHLDWRVNWIDARVDAQLLVPAMPEPAVAPVEEKKPE